MRKNFLKLLFRGLPVKWIRVGKIKWRSQKKF